MMPAGTDTFVISFQVATVSVETLEVTLVRVDTHRAGWMQLKSFVADTLVTPLDIDTVPVVTAGVKFKVAI